MRERRSNGRMTATKSRETEYEELAQLREDLIQVKEDIAALSKSLLSAGQEKLRRMDERVREGASAAINSTREQVEARPLTALGAALGAGLLLGAIMRWARRHQEA